MRGGGGGGYVCSWGYGGYVCLWGGVVLCVGMGVCGGM